MRWLFLLVLSLNLAYFAWQLSMTSSADYADVPALKNVEPIVLLNELKQKAVNKTAEITSPSQRETEVVVMEGKDLVEKTLEKKISGNDGLESASVKKAVQPESVNAKKTVEISPPEKKPVDVATEVPVEPSSVSQCYTLGPFRDLKKLRGLTREIKAYVVTADFRGHEESEQTLYWVYVNPEKTQKKAIATGRRLKTKKIKDFYVIREGDKINGLSLGHFRSKKGAYGLAKKVRKLGFNVTVEPIFKTYTVYWLDYQLANGVTIPKASLDKYIQMDEKGKFNRLSRECLG